MEKPEFRIIGGVSEKAKLEARESLENLLYDHYHSLPPEVRAGFAKHERLKKSEKELACIDFANRETNEIMTRLGVKPYDVPGANFHIVDAEFFEREISPRFNAVSDYEQQSVIFNARYFPSELLFGQTALHETLHLKGHQTAWLEENRGKTEGSVFRAGWNVFQHPKSRKNIQSSGNSAPAFFVGLHEAVVETQNVKSFHKVLDLPAFKKEKDVWESAGAKSFRKSLAEKNNFAEEEMVMWLDIKNNLWRAGTFSYLKQRQALRYVCEEIQKQFSEKYKSADDVFDEFLKAQFTGNILPCGRLVEETFGKGSFRILGEMGIEPESALACLDRLKAARLAIIGPRNR